MMLRLSSTTPCNYVGFPPSPLTNMHTLLSIMGEHFYGTQQNSGFVPWMIMESFLMDLCTYTLVAFDVVKTHFAKAQSTLSYLFSLPSLNRYTPRLPN